MQHWTDPIKPEWNKDLVEMGKPALEAARLRFRQQNLRVYGIIKEARARAAEVSEPEAEAYAKSLDEQRKTVRAGSSKWTALTHQYNRQVEILSNASPGVDAASAAVWRSERALEGVCHDLRAKLRFLEAEAEKIITTLSAVNRENGWGELSNDALAWSSPAHAALTEFMKRHLAPGLAHAESALANCKNPNAVDANAEGACFVLLGQGWRTVTVPQSWLTTIADAVLPGRT